MPRIVRPTSLLGLALHAAWLFRNLLGCAFLLAILLLMTFLQCGGCARRPPRLATFNIENYPRSTSQKEGAFNAIRALSVPVVAVQEITDPAGFCEAARQRLGSSWDCAFTDRPVQRIGIVFDRSVLELLATTIHPEPEVYEGAKPAFQARLRPRGGGEATRVVVVHLKAGGDGGPVRARQLQALAPVLTAAVQSGDLVVMLGDFNATGPGDRDTIGAFARSTGLRFASAGVPCTAYWNRRDGCLGVALDQVLTSIQVDVQAEGPCRTEGCEMRPACPAFHGAVSDHCPVTVGF